MMKINFQYSFFNFFFFFQLSDLSIPLSLLSTVINFVHQLMDQIPLFPKTSKITGIGFLAS